MKLWILRPVEELDDDNPWDPIYDKTFGFVIRAETEDQARSIAHSNGRDENANTVLDDPDSSVKKTMERSRIFDVCRIIGQWRCRRCFTRVAATIQKKGVVWKNRQAMTFK